MESQQEKKNQRTALLVTLVTHGAVLLLLIFLVAWRTPNPPLPEVGIELNFGLDQQGSGQVQPEQPVGAAEEAPEETEPVEETAPPEQTEEVIEEMEPIEQAPVEPEVVAKEESPVVKKEEEKPKPQPEKPVEKPVEKPEPKKEEPKPNPVTQYKPTTPTKSESADKSGTAGNQGDDEGKTGDKGDPKGTLDANAQYGKQGGGGGGVSMSGFNGFEWPKIETPTLPDEAYGVYEFMVKVDDQGYVTSVTPVQRGLSAEAEKRLKAYIQKLQFIPKGSNLPEFSEGKIAFRVVSK